MGPKQRASVRDCLRYWAEGRRARNENLNTIPLLGTYFRNTVVVILQITINFAVHKPIASRRSEKLFSLYFAMYSRVASTKSP